MDRRAAPSPRSQRNWNVPAQPSNQEPVRIPSKQTSKTQQDDDGPEQSAAPLRKRWRPPQSNCNSNTPCSTLRTLLWNRAPRSRSGRDGKLTVWTGTQRPFGVRDELMAAFHLPAQQGPSDPARHGQRLRRQTYRRGSRRSSAPRQGSRQTCKGRVDARRRIHLGLFSSRRTDRDPQRRASATARWSPGNITITTPALRPSTRRTTSPTSSSNFIQQTRPCARVPIADSPPPPTTLRASLTWMSWPTPSAWTRWNSA